ncbi:MAG: hypothetical protein E6H95_08810 [Chloroflexi bacterium]|nr:MAG: hypothetical protein E6I21_06085 [Chloroflexota bacterium]TMG27310.1 MAG: hypothetical protein E6H95_08810 [Chloroflexota bacterium]
MHGAQLDFVANPDCASSQDPASQSRVQQTLEHDLRADELRQVVARLASLFAFALELAHLEAPADEIAEVDAPHQYLASSQSRVEIEAVLRGLILKPFGFDQGDVARVGVGVAEVPISLEALAGMPKRRLDRMGRFSVDCREINRFYSADCPIHDPGGYQ